MLLALERVHSTHATVSHCTFQLFMHGEAIDYHATAARLLVRKMVAEVNVARERRATLGEAIAKLLAQPSIQLRLAGLKVCVPSQALSGVTAYTHLTQTNLAVHLRWTKLRLSAVLWRDARRSGTRRRSAQSCSTMLAEWYCPSSLSPTTKSSLLPRAMTTRKTSGTSWSTLTVSPMRRGLARVRPLVLNVAPTAQSYLALTNHRSLWATEDPVALAQELVARPVRSAAALVAAVPSKTAAAALTRVSRQRCVALLSATPAPCAAEVLQRMPQGTVYHVLEKASSSTRAALVSHLPQDAIIDLGSEILSEDAVRVSPHRCRCQSDATRRSLRWTC